MDRKGALELYQLPIPDRVARLETSSDYQHLAHENRFAGLERRLTRVEQQIDQDRLLSTGSIIKFLLALIFPILIFLMLGRRIVL